MPSILRLSPLRIWAGLWRDVVLNTFIASSFVPVAGRWRLLKRYGMRVEKSTISAGVWFGSKNVSVGEGTFINTGCMFSTHARIAIGERCDLGMRVLIFTGSHEVGETSRRAGEFYSQPVSIGNGSWIGANVTIMPGVTIGAGSIVAAGAVVTRDCDPDAIYGGVPATKIRDLR